MTPRRFKPSPIPAIVSAFTENIEHYKPVIASNIVYLGFELREIGQGKFRRCYEVVGHECIVKVPRRYDPKPHHPTWRNPIHHSQIEVETLRMIMEDDKYEHLRRYVPQVYYSCLETGLVVMPHYLPPPLAGRHEEMAMLGQMFRDTLKKWTADYIQHNIMRTNDGGLVVVDLGY